MKSRTAALPFAYAFLAELVISFVLMSVVLVASNSPRLAPYTALLCGTLVATYITFEAPISGITAVLRARSGNFSRVN